VSSKLVNPLNRRLLQELARERVRDARALLQNGRYAAAHYLCGYAVECALKACIAKATNKHDFPDLEAARAVHTHNLEQLLGSAGLKSALDNARRADNSLDVNWSIVVGWKETNRYRTGISKQQAHELYQAITDRGNGVLKWVKTFW